jgi:hypothetical protein
MFAVLFAPAADRWLVGSTQGASAPVEARVLAPTIREAVAAASPKHILRHLPVRDQPSLKEPLTAAVASIAAAALLLWALLSAGTRRALSQRLIVLGDLGPRAPPPFQAA